MGIDDDLRAAQHRQQSESTAAEQKRAETERRRSSYDAEEKTVVAEVSAALRRAQQLLDAQSKWEPIQAYASSRFAPGSDFLKGRLLPLPSSLSYVLLATGHIIYTQTWLKRREANSPAKIEEWSAGWVREARIDSRTESRRSLYEDAFSDRWPNDQSLSRMQQQLAGVRASTVDAVGRMLARAEIYL
jgi:hypothetical protein